MLAFLFSLRVQNRPAKTVLDAPQTDGVDTLPPIRTDMDPQKRKRISPLSHPEVKNSFCKIPIAW